ncbi:protein of unknown function [Nitrosotalea devaniterrae]|uniref:Uncharacterized protein n=1 Tax=Nitrosotalea devaniterrae TaxID=1078905 RepID=A0A128A4F1_9ARCH|nr:protein of unknown function [Candidatus Nitrosotalea devanaterra]
MLNIHAEYFKKKLGVLPIETLWEIIDKLISPYHNSFNKKSMSYDDVLELAVVLQTSNEIFRNLEQIAVIKKELDSENIL